MYFHFSPYQTCVAARELIARRPTYVSPIPGIALSTAGAPPASSRRKCTRVRCTYKLITPFLKRRSNYVHFRKQLLSLAQIRIGNSAMLQLAPPADTDMTSHAMHINAYEVLLYLVQLYLISNEVILASRRTCKCGSQASGCG